MGSPGAAAPPLLARFGRRFRRRRPARAWRSRGAVRRNFSGAATGAKGRAARRPFQRPRRERPQNARRRALVSAAGTPPFALVPPRPGEPRRQGFPTCRLIEHTRAPNPDARDDQGTSPQKLAPAFATADVLTPTASKG